MLYFITLLKSVLKLSVLPMHITCAKLQVLPWKRTHIYLIFYLCDFEISTKKKEEFRIYFLKNLTFAFWNYLGPPQDSGPQCGVWTTVQCVHAAVRQNLYSCVFFKGPHHSLGQPLLNLLWHYSFLKSIFSVHIWQFTLHFLKFRETSSYLLRFNWIIFPLSRCSRINIYFSIYHKWHMQICREFAATKQPLVGLKGKKWYY